MRILHIVTYMGRGGLETMLMNYYRHINREKIQFDFLVHRDFEADYDAEIKELGGRIYHVPRLVPWSKTYKRELKRFFGEHPEYKIVHVHQDCLSSVALRCAKECGIPIRIAHSHSSGAVRNWKYLIKLYYMKQISQYATDKFACGKQAGDWMFCGEKYEIIRNAVDTKQYCYSSSKDMDVRQELSLRDRIVVGHVGNFRLEKNHMFLLEVFQEVVSLEPNAVLMLIGDGEDKEYIQKIHEKVTEMCLENKVLFMGMRTDVNKLMQCMNVFVLPSLHEGVPVTMIEAQAEGLPCVVSDQVSNECIIIENLVSKMKLSASPKEWARHILSKTKTQKKNHHIEIAKAGYDIEISTRKLEEYYIQKYMGE